MSKVKQAIETALENINSASRNTYGAKLYTFEQVAMILHDIYETAKETDEAGMPVLTLHMIADLVERIEAKVDENISGLSDTDIVDSDSLELTISGGRVSIDSIDVDKDGIISEATYGIENVITDWADEHDINLEN